VAYGIGAPQASLAQQPMAIAPVAGMGASASIRAAAALVAEGFYFPSGPDNAGDALPKVSGTFDTLTAAYDQALASKLWIDLPAGAGAYQVAVAVAQMLLSGTAADGPTAGELVITPRQTYADLAGRIRLRFNASATPACVAWDSEPNGTYETESCLSFADLVALWQAPQPGLPLPVAVQRAASATYTGWTRFHAQFDFSVGALLVAEANYDALRAAAAQATAVTVNCSVYPPTGGAGSYTLAWSDRNGSGRFDTGDDVRFVATDCWTRMEGEPNPGAGQLLAGTFELRGYERNVGAAPTFAGLRVTTTAEVGGVIVPQEAIEITGGFGIRAPGITASAGEVAAYDFTPANVLAAGSVAARSMTYYKDVGDLAYQALAAIRTSTTTPRNLGLCANAGTSTLTFAEGASYPAGLSDGDTVTLALTNCNLGSAANPAIMDGTLRLTVWGMTAGPGTDWSMQTNARLDLQTVTTRGTARRLGEFGLRVDYVLGHSFLAGFRPQSYSATETLGGVLTAMENGALAYQLGCFDASTFRGTAAASDYQLKPNHVVKTANRVFTIGMRMGELFLFKLDGAGNYYPDIALAAMLSISAPECVALGVPVNGVTGGDTNIQFDTWPAGDGDTVRLRLYDRNNTLLREESTRWSVLVQ
jgi:hypothetical protein